MAKYLCPNKRMLNTSRQVYATSFGCLLIKRKVNGDELEEIRDVYGIPGYCITCDGFNYRCEHYERFKKLRVEDVQVQD